MKNHSIRFAIARTLRNLALTSITLLPAVPGLSQTPAGTLQSPVGSFETTFYQPGPRYAGFRTIDMNADGRPEIVAARYTDSKVEIWEFDDPTKTLLLRDTVTFSSGSTPASQNIHDVAVGDFNHDGKIDLAVAKRGAAGLQVAINHAPGDAHWGGPWLESNPAPTYGWQVDAADFNLDGNPDLMFGMDNSMLAVLTGDGDGGFSPAAAPPFPGSFSYRAGRGFTPVDLNDDGYPDIIGTPTETSGRTYGYLRAFLNQSSAGTLAWSGNIGPASPIQASPPPILNPSGCAADYDQNGFIDQPFLLGNGTFGMMWGTQDAGSLTWTKQILAETGLSGLGAQPVDVDGDDWMDLILFSHDFPGLWVFLNDRAGGFLMETIPVPQAVGVYWRSVAGADMDLDGHCDLMVAPANGGMLFLRRVNLPPVADAGPPQVVQLGNTVYFDAAASTDDMTPMAALVKAWTIQSTPADSTATLTPTTAATVTLEPDMPGVYEVLLTVADEEGASSSATTTVTVNPVMTGGGFEQDFTGWAVSGNLSIQSAPPYQIFEGLRTACFNAANMPPNGVLSQAIQTVPGQQYRLEFAAGVLSYHTGSQKLGITLTGNSALVADTLDLAGPGGGGTFRVNRTYPFVADGDSATLVFRDLSRATNGIDMVLDDIRITPLVTTLLVNSSLGSGIPVAVSPADTFGESSGDSSFRRYFNPGSEVHLAAPPSWSGKSFLEWRSNDQPFGGDASIRIPMDASRIMTAVYRGGEPVITSQPEAVGAMPGGRAVFRVVASGSLPLAYQWRHNGEELAGARTAELIIDPVSPDDAGNYEVMVSNRLGAVTSQPASLTILPDFPGLENGGFESEFQGWTVSGNLWIQSTPPYQPTEGAMLTSFNAGNTPPDGELSQSFDTAAGRSYTLRFDMGALAYNTRIQSMVVTVEGDAVLAQQSFQVKGIGKGATHWVSHSLTFTADRPRTTIRFRDASTDTLGIDLVLDHVRVDPWLVRVLTVGNAAVPDIIVWQDPVIILPPDENGDADGMPVFHRRYLDGTRVWLTAPDDIRSAGEGPAITYIFEKWQMNGADHDFSATTSLVMESDTTMTAVYRYRPPEIHRQPASVVVGEGWEAFFHVEAGLQYASEVLQYEWRHNGSAIPGANQSFLRIDCAAERDAGSYDVVVTNVGGSTTSEAATLTVLGRVLANGGFETGLDGWSATGNVRVQAAPSGAAPEGEMVLAFNTGNSPPNGSIAQSFTTVPGGLYMLSFEMGAYGFNNNLQRVRVDLPGSDGTRSEFITIRGIGGGKTAWGTRHLSFAAPGSATTLVFTDTSTTTNAIDLLLDHIRLQPIPGGFAWIPATSFRMGDSTGFNLPHELPVHEVTVGGLFMSKHEVSKALWDKVRRWGEARGYATLLPGWGKRPDHPVVMIRWHELVKWCNARSEMEGLAPCYTVNGEVYRTGISDAVVCDWNADGYRLPTEAEWEMAARGGFDGRRFPWGSLIDHQRANYKKNGFDDETPGGAGLHPDFAVGPEPYTAPIGTFPPNGFGLFDMSGNVAEWCWDWFGADYYPSSPSANPTGPELGSVRVVRGGSWQALSFYQRVATRTHLPPAYSFDNALGFRVVRRPVPLVVTTTEDEDDGGPGMGTGESLREVIHSAAASPAMDHILFSPSLDGGTLTLAGKPVTIATDTLIDATMLPSGITVSGASSTRVFAIKPGTTAAMTGFTIADGSLFQEDGAGIHNAGSLRLRDMMVADNQIISFLGSSPHGAGIFNSGNLRIDSSTIAYNALGVGGGAGIHNAGELVVANSTIAHNQSVGAAAGISNAGSLALVHSTVSGNVSVYGPGAGVFNLGNLLVENTILAGNFQQEGAPGDLEGESHESRGVNLIGGDPKLSAMGFHGGITEVMFPLAGSPAMDAALWLESTPVADQNGNPRSVEAPDIGAIEIQPAPDGFAHIPAGPFQMGDTFAEGHPGEVPVHTVQVSGFYMARFEVTKALWDEVRAWALSRGYGDLPPGYGKAADHPVQGINWYHMVKWCNARSEKENLTPCYRIGNSIYRFGTSDHVICDWSSDGYRLPTEAEWEKAARGGLAGKRYPWGDTISHNEANYYASGPAFGNLSTAGYHPLYRTGSEPFTSPVGSFAPNGYGLHDMAGNSWERCWDWYHADYYKMPQPGNDPRGPAAPTGQRVVRSGTWQSNAWHCRVACRDYGSPQGTGHIGFRIARSRFAPGSGEDP